MGIITGWGRYPAIDSEVFAPLTQSSGKEWLQQGASGIARGLGRSYGDSALAPRVFSTRHLNHILDFDSSSGTVHCQAGVSFADLLELFVPRGWFPAVTPGTRFVTVGGAIASDIHGKNHHTDGCFSNFVLDITMMLADGTITTCSPSHQRDLFLATCGGMGLTGIILAARFTLKSVQSAYVHETTIKAGNVAEAIDLLDAHANRQYSVAWIDCLSRGARLGRSLLMLGEHADDGNLVLRDTTGLTVPVGMPGFLLHRYLVRGFNAFYYHRSVSTKTTRLVHYEPFFYPLDRIKNWNRLYGKSGFQQYQFVVPASLGKTGITAILQKITESGRGSFLAVLKAFGAANENYLSFPMKGYTLAVDFRREAGLDEFLEGLDRIVLDHGGRVYLTKDTRLKEAAFKRGYPGWKDFANVRQQYQADKVFRSLQSDRLGL